VRLFLRKSRVEIGCPVYTRSENAITGKPRRREDSASSADLALRLLPKQAAEKVGPAHEWRNSEAKAKRILGHLRPG
jgi:hypothetical protein